MRKDRSLKCLRCGDKMNALFRKKLQLGSYDIILGSITNLVEGAMELDIYACPSCGKVEFFQPEEYFEGLPQKKCPNCGAMIDFDHWRCPQCKYKFDSN